VKKDYLAAFETTKEQLIEKLNQISFPEEDAESFASIR
jgi:hypothetical protein